MVEETYFCVQQKISSKPIEQSEKHNFPHDSLADHLAKQPLSEKEFNAIANSFFFFCFTSRSRSLYYPMQTKVKKKSHYARGNFRIFSDSLYTS